ncbi:carboxypeptidase-like regulatory domain-containing protein [Geoanaerobacter pelophilus]|nr:carboxypeptidase-like regulatory domain-containing protein [Geoanaerobacter pelophilus]
MIRYCLLLLILLASVLSAKAEVQGSGKITGAWIAPPKGPIAGALVYAFNAESGPPPTPERYWRVPDGMAVTDNNGKFSLDLPDGTYYLGTLKKPKGNQPGPPADGDLYFFSRDAKGAPKKYVVTGGSSLSAGTFRKAEPFKTPAIKITDGITAITGTVKGDDGVPVAGVMVLAYLNEEMTGRPLFVSFRTGKDGRYLLQVDQAGTYYLKIRSSYGGGRPHSGDILGKYGGETPIPVQVGNNIITKGIDITVERFEDMRPEEPPL